MATLTIATTFLNDYARLESRLQRRIGDLVTSFAQMTPAELGKAKGVNLEPYNGSADPRSRTIRITRNHRGIVLDVGDGEHFVLTRVCTHDEAERWMTNNTFKVNAATQALEVIDMASITTEVEAAVAAEPSSKPSLFAHRRDRDFVNLGVDEELVPALMALTSEDQLAGLIGLFPPSQADAVIGLTTDAEVDEIYRELAGAIDKEFDTDDVVAALEAPASQAAFHVVEGQDELADILAQPLAMWRIFLHPSQRHLAYRDSYSGPARVTGGAGTGKTVVAIHRAKVLAERLESPLGKPILFTTFTRNLAQAIENDLRALDPAAVSRVDVINVDRLVFALVREAEGRDPKVAQDDYCKKVADEVVTERAMDIEYSGSFLVNEWEQVVLANNCRSRADYFAVSRAGRGIPLNRRRRAEVWKAIDELERRLDQAGRRTHLQLAAAAAGYLEPRTTKPYQHVVVDEAQDLHEAQWRLLRAVVAEAPGDMFIVGDSHQRIYDRRSSLSKVGIKVVGRSAKLKLNYRTTHEIMAWSLAMLGTDGGVTADDLDGGSDKHSFAGYHSLRSGPEPVLAGFRTRPEMLDALVEQVRAWIDEGVDPIAIGLAARTNRQVEAAKDALDSAGLTTCLLPQKDLPSKPGVRLGTMHRMKGLEYERVAVSDADDASVPAGWAMTERDDDPVQHASDLELEKSLLYVAATRARDGLYITWSGTPSRFLG
jgi:hypothetical protein